MKRRPMLLLFGIGLLLGTLSLGSTCSDANPRGKISPSPVEASVGDSVSLSLELPLRYEGVHREQWIVKPESLGKVFANAAEIKRRNATFEAKAAGTGTIEVKGFFPPNNSPVAIAEVRVTVK